MISLAEARRNMVDCQLRPFEVHDRAVLGAIGSIPRETFLPADMASLAYRDGNLALPASGPEGEERALLAPMVLARLIQALEIEPGTRVLDVAGGYGYSAAILRHLGAAVTTLESSPALAGLDANLGPLLEGVTRRTGDLAQGAPADGPFDAILINGAVDREPTELLTQLAEGGRLACLRAEGRRSRAMLFVRSGPGFGSRPLFDAAAPSLAAFREVPGFVF
ncbi:protein-L-isoaspartate O-methyltransferase [Enterovirga sp.]|uniref:protein-L-isoaspartate O-methyltransferase family protein n=1 Tax=Enterovirga sp. TaxID=2026350 RepID=UPI0026399049|nr:protein-L-isoaspartate O-methyltransferase [Enterovirga sp.]MDB5591665.1 protein-L-isoaspartate(D-aspartate) O-methyltransferase [Enterovirga sp.]